MAKQTTIIYKCPFCTLVWFETAESLAWHLWKIHAHKTCLEYAHQNKQQTTRKKGKWAT